MELVGSGAMLSEGYRAGVVAGTCLSADELHSPRLGVKNVLMNMYGHAGPVSQRAGWEQLGQSVSGKAIEDGGAANPRLVLVGRYH